MTVRVVQFQRRARPGNFSVERLFEDVRTALPRDVHVDLRLNRHVSRGVAGRLTDALRARIRRGAVNHVLGDVHYLTWFLPREGTILTVLDCVSLERMKGLRKRVFWFLWYWWPLQHADQVTVISEYTRDSLLDWVRYPAERIHVIPPPLSGEFEASPPPPRGERLRLLQVGTGKNKNLERVIQAASALPVTLVIVGRLNPDLEAALKRHEIRYENHFNLERAQLVEQYRLADALVFASTYEGFGLPIIEAQAVGRPVITSNVCSMPEAAGGAAYLVDPFSVDEIRGGIKRFIEDPEYCEELVQLGRTNALRYTPERIAAAYAAVYRSVHDRQGRQT